MHTCRRQQGARRVQDRLRQVPSQRHPRAARGQAPDHAQRAQEGAERVQRRHQDPSQVQVHRQGRHVLWQEGQQGPHHVWRHAALQGRQQVLQAADQGGQGQQAVLRHEGVAAQLARLLLRQLLHEVRDPSLAFASRPTPALLASSLAHCWNHQGLAEKPGHGGTRQPRAPSAAAG